MGLREENNDLITINNRLRLENHILKDKFNKIIGVLKNGKLL